MPSRVRVSRGVTHCCAPTGPGATPPGDAAMGAAPGAVGVTSDVVELGPGPGLGGSRARSVLKRSMHSGGVRSKPTKTRFATPAISASEAIRQPEPHSCTTAHNTASSAGSHGSSLPTLGSATAPPASRATSDATALGGSPVSCFLGFLGFLGLGWRGRCRLVLSRCNLRAALAALPPSRLRGYLPAIRGSGGSSSSICPSCCTGGSSSRLTSIGGGEGAWGTPPSSPMPSALAARASPSCCGGSAAATFARFAGAGLWL
mmetsp:Transcript_34510/g.65929  ORF Transcript_34510/g.65929 Transcript_34510/m.65929 type:complete len:260 (+) Transcript_34510:642-1421(+)